MAESVTLETKARDSNGSRAAKKLRKQGLIPVVLYGHKEKTISFSVPGDELASAVRHGVRVLDLKTGAEVQKALIKELQWDHLGKELLHADFTRIDVDERVTLTVPIELRGIAPGVTAGGSLDQPLHNLLVECLALSIPEHIRVNVGELQIDGTIYVRDLHLPEGVKPMADPDAIVVHVAPPRVEAEAPVAAAAAETAEPELIGRKPAEEEEAE